MAASAVFHGLLLLFAVATLKGSVVTGGGAEGEDAPVVTVTLAGFEGGRHSTADVQTAELKAILRQIQNSELQAVPQTPTATTPRTSLNKLLDEIDHEAAIKDSKTAGSGRGKSDQGGQGATTSKAPAKASDKAVDQTPSKTPGQAGASASSGALWGQVEPCWRRLPGVSAVPVTLEVILNGQGLIATPPVILRPKGSALEEQRLIAEARAIAAISACVPYVGAVTGGSKQSFKLEFAASK
jgi:hypothetical protein